MATAPLKTLRNAQAGRRTECPGRTQRRSLPPPLFLSRRCRMQWTLHRKRCARRLEISTLVGGDLLSWCPTRRGQPVGGRFSTVGTPRCHNAWHHVGLCHFSREGHGSECTLEYISVLSLRKGRGSHVRRCKGKLGDRELTDFQDISHTEHLSAE